MPNCPSFMSPRILPQKPHRPESSDSPVLTGGVGTSRGGRGGRGELQPRHRQTGVPIPPVVVDRQAPSKHNLLAMAVENKRYLWKHKKKKHNKLSIAAQSQFLLEKQRKSVRKKSTKSWEKENWKRIVSFDRLNCQVSRDLQAKDSERELHRIIWWLPPSLFDIWCNFR